MKAIMGFGFFLLFLAGIALVMLQGRETVGAIISLLQCKPQKANFLSVNWVRHVWLVRSK